RRQCRKVCGFESRPEHHFFPRSGWNGGMLDGWMIGLMEWWNGGMVECWNGGMLDCSEGTIVLRECRAKLHPILSDLNRRLLPETRKDRFFLPNRHRYRDRDRNFAVEVRAR
ncbi:MAG: hypothetical protein JJU20_13805, partial [Opitutales bacterium]|nr:hypothetical protein [Opitutales bacterium]